MYTQCPHCHGIFRVDAALLSDAGGRVQCGACELNFDALASLRDELPPDSERWRNTELPFTPPEPAPGEAETGNHSAPPAGSASSSIDRPRPPVTSAWDTGKRGNDRLWFAASALLLVALAGQLVFLAPPALADHARLRPVAEALCGLSGCDIAPRRDLGRLRLASRDVRAHPSVPGALIISATMVNEAAFRQPYPVLEISLGNLRGRQVALRRFEPPVYLPDSVDIGAGMAPDSRVQVSLEVVDPGKSAVAFQFAFRASYER